MISFHEIRMSETEDVPFSFLTDAKLATVVYESGGGMGFLFPLISNIQRHLHFCEWYIFVCW